MEQNRKPFLLQIVLENGSPKHMDYGDVRFVDWVLVFNGDRSFWELMELE